MQPENPSDDFLLLRSWWSSTAEKRNVVCRRMSRMSRMRAETSEPNTKLRHRGTLAPAARGRDSARHLPMLGAASAERGVSTACDTGTQ